MLDDPGVFVFADLHPALGDPVVVRHLKEIAQRAKQGQTIVVAGAERNVPAELEGVALPWSLKPPSAEELERLVKRTIRDLKGRGLEADLDDDAIEDFAQTLRGLSIGDAERLIQRAALAGDGLESTDLARLRAAKAEL